MSVLALISTVLLLTCGVYLTVKSRFFQFVGIKNIYASTFGKLIKTKDYSGFKAMAIALGSTIGTGNIIGVAAAICVGGPGAVFWMLVIGFLGMIVKYFEIYVCISNKLKSGRQVGGPMYVIKDNAKGVFKVFGSIFAGVCILTSLLAGNLIQSKSMYEFSAYGFGVGEVLVTFISLPLLYMIISGKDRIYQNFSSVFVPLMSVAYISATLFIIFKNFSNLPLAIVSVFKSAFGINELCGGFCGATLISAIRVGVMKGLFTNEAGLGSSPIAHCSARNGDSHIGGCWGIVEVFIDTIVVCMLTALAILTSPIYINGEYNEPLSLVSKVFQSVFGTFGSKALSISIICFAFAAIVGWSFYGIKSVAFFTENKLATRVYIVFYLLCVPLSLLIETEKIWILTDSFNSLMLIPNVVLLFIFGKNIKGNNKYALQNVSKRLRRFEK